MNNKSKNPRANYAGYNAAIEETFQTLSSKASHGKIDLLEIAAKHNINKLFGKAMQLLGYIIKNDDGTYTWTNKQGDPSTITDSILNLYRRGGALGANPAKSRNMTSRMPARSVSKSKAKSKLKKLKGKNNPQAGTTERYVTAALTLLKMPVRDRGIKSCKLTGVSDRLLTFMKNLGLLDQAHTGLVEMKGVSYDIKSEEFKRALSKELRKQLVKFNASYQKRYFGGVKQEVKEADKGMRRKYTKKNLAHSTESKPVVTTIPRVTRDSGSKNTVVALAKAFSKHGDNEYALELLNSIK